MTFFHAAKLLLLQAEQDCTSDCCLKIMMCRRCRPDYELREKLSAYTYDELRKMLEKFDPQRAAEIELNDKKKVIRAIEMAEHLEKPLSEYRKELEFDVEWIGLNFPREELYERINVRVDMMVKAGLVEETENLLQKHGRIKNLTCTTLSGNDCIFGQSNDFR